MFDPSMLGKLGEMKQAAEASKQRLDSVIVEGNAGNGLIVVTMTGNRKLRSLKINQDIQSMTTEDLEDLLSVALNKALDAAEQAQQRESMNTAQALFNGMK